MTETANTMPTLLNTPRPVMSLRSNIPVPSAAHPAAAQMSLQITVLAESSARCVGRTPTALDSGKSRGRPQIFEETGAV
jgi:hypothetical protein